MSFRTWALTVTSVVAGFLPVAASAQKIANVTVVTSAEWSCAPEGHDADDLTMGSYLVVRSDLPLAGHTLLLNGQPLTRAELYECGGEQAAGSSGQKTHLSGYWLRFGNADQATWEAAFASGRKLVLGFQAGDAKPILVPTELSLKKWTGATRLLAASLPILMFVVILALAFGSGALRDPGPYPARQRPYSLARTQIALWTALVALAVGWHYFATGQLTAIPDSIAALMGLSTFTLGAATVIDASKAKPAAAPAVALAGAGGAGGISPILAAAVPAAPPAAPTAASPPVAAPISESFLKDILTDRNGVSMHRLQMVVWTVILAAVFLDAVVRRLFLPELAPGYLAITGVSSAGYALLKIPERQS
jgi:hypothetical protein